MGSAVPLSVLLALCLCAVAAADWQKPDFCKGRDCPKFSQVDQADGYETRRYEAAWWAEANVEGAHDADAAVMEAVAEISQYFNGSNEKGEPIPFGTPLALNITRRAEDVAGALSRKGKKAPVSVTAKLFFTYDYQEGKEQAPKPNSERVQVVQHPELTAHVLAFEGWPTRHNFKKHAKALLDYLDEDNKQYSDRWAVFSIYDSPIELDNRHNEVLFQAEAGPSAVEPGCGAF